MAKQGQKLTDELKEIIKANLVLSDNKNEIAKKLNISWATVDKIAKEMKDVPEEEEKYEKLREDKKNMMIDRIWGDMELALDLGTQKIRVATVAMNEFQPTIDRLIELLEDKEDVKGGDVVEVIKALSSITSIPLGQVSTYFGTLYDKRALMKGENTSSVGMNGTLNHRHVSDLSDEDLEKIAYGHT
jgi:hypothetical protein